MEKGFTTIFVFLVAFVGKAGPPEKPASNQTFVTPATINIQWNSMWDNGREQYFILHLNDLGRSSLLEQINLTRNSYYNAVYRGFPYYSYSSNDYYYNYTHVANFTTNINPDTDYEVVLWAQNDHGQSDIIRISIRTPVRPKFTVLTESISIVGNQSFIEFSVDNGIATSLVVQCYELTLMKYAEINFSLENSSRRVNMTIPSGSNHQFIFRLYHWNDMVAYQKVLVPAENSSQTTGMLCQKVFVPEENSSQTTGMPCQKVFVPAENSSQTTESLNNDNKINRQNDAENSAFQNTDPTGPAGSTVVALSVVLSIVVAVAIGEMITIVCLCRRLLSKSEPPITENRPDENHNSQNIIRNEEDGQNDRNGDILLQDLVAPVSIPDHVRKPSVQRKGFQQQHSLLENEGQGDPSMP